MYRDDPYCENNILSLFYGTLPILSLSLGLWN